MDCGSPFEVAHFSKELHQTTWDSYSAFYWFILKELLNNLPSYEVWGKLFVMEHNRLVFDVNLDLERYPEVKLCGSDSVDGSKQAGRLLPPGCSETDESSESSDSDGGGVTDADDTYKLHLHRIAHTSDRAAPEEPWRSSAAKRLVGEVGVSGLQVRYSVFHGIYMLSRLPLGVAIYLRHFTDTPLRSVHRLHCNKPTLAFNATMFKHLCSQFHSQLKSYPHINEFNVKTLLQLCVFNVSLEGGAAASEDVMSCPLWFTVVNVMALAQVLREACVRHIIRCEHILLAYKLKGGRKQQATSRRLSLPVDVLQHQG